MKSEIYILEDDKEYELVDSIIKGKTKYLLLIENENYAHICIRKEIDDFVDRLEEEEYTMILNEFIEKNKDLFK